MSYSDLYIVDNTSEEQSVKSYLEQWCDVSKQMDIATGYLEVDGLLSLDGSWQKLDKIRIILGNQVTKRTKKVIDDAVQMLLDRLKNSVDAEQVHNEFLIGVRAILEAMVNGKIECRVFDKNKFHAKTYITYFREEYKDQFIEAMNIPAGYALVGSSNFTKAGLTQNVELNVQVNNDVEQLQEWFTARWEEAQDITEAVIQVIENHCREYSPYDVYLRSMYEYFRGEEESVSEWEKHNSVVYPSLAQYQKDGYNSLIHIAERYSGAFLCDGVGLGKTYIGLMLIERFVKKETKNVVLLVPASARVPVWETTIKEYLPEILSGYFPFRIINHTDLLSQNEQKQESMNQIVGQAKVVIIDEAHHFRNQASGRYKMLKEMIGQGPRKQMFMLTATPINNSFFDLQHLIELFTQDNDKFFEEAPLGIHSLTGQFKKMENQVKAIANTDVANAVDVSDNVFKNAPLVNELVVQRSRAYVKKSLLAEDNTNVLFSVRQDPIVANYSLKKSYGKLIDDFIDSFYRKDKNGIIKPILTLAVYSPYEDDYYIGDKEKLKDMPLVTGRQAQVVNLIRQLLLKRFESSVVAFEETCIRIYIRLKKFLTDYMEYGDEGMINRTFESQAVVIDYVEHFVTDVSQQTMDDVEDGLPDYVWESPENFDVSDLNIEAMLVDTVSDMEVLARFIEDMMTIAPEDDDKLRKLTHILKEDPQIQGKKIIIFSEYRATAKYIFTELQKAGFQNLYEIDGQSQDNRFETIQRFAPYYNGTCSAEVKDEIQILIATDVLAEGLNLQDASCLINYELHWNPVRLMQRIGRIDRRRDADVEDRLLADHPQLADDREKAYYWNFLPPAELEKLLSLYKTVSTKTLRISKTFGIEGKKLLTPEDHYEALKEFNSQYEGETSPKEEIALAYQKLLAANPDYVDLVEGLPKKMYSGKMASTRKGFFFCYELPSQRTDGTWTKGDGLYRWYLIDTENNEITEQPQEIWEAIQCRPEEERVLAVTEEQFVSIKKDVEAYIKRNYMRNVQVRIGVEPRLVTWMQLC